MTPVPSAHDPLSDERRLIALTRDASREFARVVYGLNDHATGRTRSMAALEITRTLQENGSPVTRELADRRARSYLPVATEEHCPRCWVFSGHTSPLRFRLATPERPETAHCDVCGAEYSTGA